MDTSCEVKVLLSQLNAFCDTVSEILNNTSVSDFARYTSYRNMAITYNDFAAKVSAVLKVPSMYYTFSIEHISQPGDTTWPMQKMILENVLLHTRILLKALEGSLDFVNDEFDNIENFLQSRLRAAIFSKPEKEIDVQNAIESLLLGRGLSKGADYDRESGKIEFSGKEYIPDFIIPKLSLCIEVKLLRPGKKSRIIEEISADITAYRKAYQRQLFVVYDLGVIQNEVEFKRDIEMSEGVKVIIIKQ